MGLTICRDIESLAELQGCSRLYWASTLAVDVVPLPIAVDEGAEAVCSGLGSSGSSAHRPIPDLARTLRRSSMKEVIALGAVFEIDIGGRIRPDRRHTSRPSFWSARWRRTDCREETDQACRPRGRRSPPRHIIAASKNHYALQRSIQPHRTRVDHRLLTLTNRCLPAAFCEHAKLQEARCAERKENSAG